MKKLLSLFVFFIFHLVSFSQTNIDGIPPKIRQEYVLFDFNKFGDEIINLSKFDDSLSKLESWYKKKVALKGDVGASISDRLSRDKEQEKIMIQYALTIINFDKELTQSILQGDGVDYQNKLNRLIEKTQKGKVTPELGQIINVIKTAVSSTLLEMRNFNTLYREKFKDRIIMAEYNNVIANFSESTINNMKKYIVTETVEEDNPVYLMALKKKQEKEVLASLPHHKYAGSFKQGYAEYTYKDSPEGERIYDGKWYYKEALGDNDYVITSEGQYKNDIRIGKWVWTYKNNGKLSAVQTFNFDENGYLHGTVTRTDYVYKKLNYTISFNHGHVIGKYTNIRDTQEQGLISIEFDNNGNAIGNAAFKLDSPPYMYYVTYNNGECVSSHTTNYQTGDKVQGFIDIRQILYRLIMRDVLSPRAIWLYTNSLSPQRKSPEIGIY